MEVLNIDKKKGCPYSTSKIPEKAFGQIKDDICAQSQSDMVKAENCF